ncbi:DNA polymerase I [Candidatus Saccharibacteria bacterium]|nr:DNA polymerase I [Candidatus Saccharibacteria bacterium]
MKKLVIIDGKSVFYRGYYAMGALSLSDGTPTGGVYGFASIAMEIVNKLKPTKVVVAWDKAKTSISKRKEIYSEYKAGRIKPPDDFYAQIPLLRELISDLGWGFLECDGYEADDIIGTLSKQADDLGDYETYIISSDLDMLQIVDENTKMYRLVKGFSKIEEIDVKAVEEKYGIKKSQFLDLKALKGDNSDNIPGVPGVGEKTAVKLLNDYLTLENIYENIEQISGSLKQKLVDGKESAFMSKKLAEIMFDAPVSLSDVPDLVVDEERIKNGLLKLEFKSLVRKFFGEKTFSSSESSFSQRVPDAPRHFYNSSLGNHRTTLPPQVSGTVVKNDRGLLTSFEKINSEDDENASDGAEIINLKFEDYLVEWDVKGRMHSDEKFAEKILSGKKFWDLSQARFLLNPLSRDEKISLFDLDKETEFLRQIEDFKKTPKLFTIFTEFDLPLIPVLFSMEKSGIKISREYFERLKTEFNGRVQEFEKEIWKLAGKEFNVNSPIQLSEILFSDLGLPTKGIKKTTRGYSTGAKELDKLKNEHEIIEKVIEYREASKLFSTYIVPLPELADENDRIHTTFTQNVTATGRLSSINPNLQNIPVRSEDGKRIRTGFVAGDGKVFVNADYSQFELRLAAVLSGDKPLIKDFNDGIDIHTKTASEAFNVPFDKVTKAQRRAAKVINFGVLYGMSAKSLADQTEMSFFEAKKFIENYFEIRKPVKEYLEKTLKQAKEEGFVETFFGRRRPTPDVKSSNFLIRSAAERAAQNMPIQGTEADLMKRAMIAVKKKLPKGAELLIQVHDSLLVECDENIADEVSEILKTTMEKVAPELDVKLMVDVGVGKDWGSL